MNALNASAGYRLWAPSYSDETAISHLENQLVSAMTPPLGGLRLLDAGCGTGRRLRGSGADRSSGLDASSAMVAAGIARDGPLRGVELVVGDVRAMPFNAGAFDVVWCRLVIGHLRRIEQAYAELGRVADLGATVVVSDFHPAAHEAGHRRSFRAGGEVIELEHHVHRPEHHIDAAREAGLVLSEMREAVIGNDVQSFYEDAGMDAVYPHHVGLPVVLALSFRREG